MKSPGETNPLQPSEVAAAVRTYRSQNPGYRVALKGDQGAPYGVVEDVMSQLQAALANRFNLVTDMAPATAQAEH